MRAKSIKGKTTAELETRLDQAMADSFTPTLAIVFLPDQSAYEALLARFDQKGIAVFGASAYGQFIDKDYDTDSIVALLLDINPACFRIEFRETGNSTTKELARSIGDAGKHIFQKPAFIIMSGGIKTNGEDIVRGIQEAAGKQATLFGGLAASSLSIMNTFIFSNGKITGDGLVALVLDEEKISVRGYATGGCQPVGIHHTITKSEGNIVYTIDDQPVLDLVLRYCGKGMDELKQGNAILNIASYFQIQLEREGASPIMRTPMFANLEDRSLVFAGSLPEGAKVKFSILPGFEVVDNVVSEFSGYSKKTGHPDAMILFSCSGREIAFGPWMGEEIERLDKIWDVPMAGFFTFGEIGQGADGHYEFYNMTCSAALLTEIENKK